MTLRRAITLRLNLRGVINPDRKRGPAKRAKQG
jgi:hypothetical protein